MLRWDSPIKPWIKERCKKMEKIQVGVIGTGKMEPGFSFNSIIEVQLSVSAKDPAGRCCAPAKRWEQTFLHPFTLPPVLPLSSPSRPGSFNQSKFIHLLKSEGGLFRKGRNLLKNLLEKSSLQIQKESIYSGLL